MGRCFIPKTHCTVASGGCFTASACLDSCAERWIGRRMAHADELYASEAKHAELVDQFEAMRQQRDALRKRVTALEVDATRYCWLREHSGEFQGPEIFVNGKYELGSDLDAVIDAARSTPTTKEQ